MKTSSKSIIVIEDIDCSINLTNRKKPNINNGGRNNNTGSNSFEPVSGGSSGPPSGPGDPENSTTNNSITLSGLLNFTDGLWSCCGSERIFVFTTNHIEKLDPALLRSGRMDMHVFMSYCSFQSLKILLKNYLGINDGDVGEDVMEELAAVIESAEMTPADISEVLIKNRRDNEKAVREVLEALRTRGEKKKVRRRVVAEMDDVAEEEEKRALDSPKEVGGGAATGGCDDVELKYGKCEKDEEDNGIN